MAKGFHEPTDKPRRFYKSVSVAEGEGGFQVRLDERAVRTPKGRVLTLPTRALAEQVAAEWAAQTDVVEIAGMHAARLANTALEAVSAAREPTAQAIAGQAASDLLCYFAEEPPGLVERQHQHWGPVLDRVAQEAKLSFVRAAGILHADQPPQTLAEVKAIALGLDDFSLAGLAFGAALFGSAILAIALQRGWLTADQAFELSRLDEAWQEERWGIDAEAAERTAGLQAEARMLGRWFEALRTA